jgi:tRNA nucleotidyltransferase (CCA-adding enzyme)
MADALPIPLPPTLAEVLARTPELATAYLVGGGVRDALLGLPNKDFDVEAFGVSYDQLARALAPWGRTDSVGRSFGVVKLTVASGETYDFTVPRRDSKVAPGHKGFEVELEPGLTLPEAAARRDFTINAVMYDPRRHEVLDFFGGMGDLQRRILRHTGPAFVEDPLRVLRGMQFAARFDLTAAPETVALCRQMKDSYGELAVERVREEWFKWAARGAKPSAGLQFLHATGWLDHFPELHAMVGVPQDPQWHPEGDVFIHTGHCCDALVRLPEWQVLDESARVVLGLAVLTHDTGKARTTQRVNQDGQERIVSPGHEVVSADMAGRFLEQIRAPLAVVEQVLPLVGNHMAHLNVVSDRAVRRLARRVAPAAIESLCVLMTADAMGRPPKPAVAPAVVGALRSKARELEVESSAPRPILLGRHLLAAGMTPGKPMGTVLDAAYEAQLDGHFSTVSQARAWVAGQDDLGLEPAVIARLREAGD